MSVVCGIVSFSFFVADGRKGFWIINIVRCSDVTLNCMLRWIVELDGCGCGFFLECCGIRY